MSATNRTNLLRSEVARRTRNSQPIAQSELQLLLARDEAARGRESLRNSILKRMQAGAVVEPGELSAMVEMRTVDRPTWDNLKACLPFGIFAHLRQVCGGVEARFLHIHDRRGKKLR